MTGVIDPGHLASLLGRPVTELQPIGGGDICEAWLGRLGDTRIFIKSLSDAPDGFFAAEARGLAWLAEAGQVRVPDVLAFDDLALVLEWIEPVRPSAAVADAFGRALARLHRAGGGVFGRIDGSGFIGTLPLPNDPARPAPTAWAEFYAERRVRPYLRVARDHDAISSADAAQVEAVLDRAAEMPGPPEPPARIHGDLWAGNLLWGADGQVRLIDAAAAHGGHRETDLAMLSLFGAPYLERILGAYQEEWPLADGWRERTALHQLHPVLVHAVLFGSSYGAHAGRLARTCQRVG